MRKYTTNDYFYYSRWNNDTLMLCGMRVKILIITGSYTSWTGNSGLSLVTLSVKILNSDGCTDLGGVVKLSVASITTVSSTRFAESASGSAVVQLPRYSTMKPAA